MHVYRISTLSGIGAEKVGGRWNRIGTRAVYCSANVSLALLEYYVHASDIGTLPAEILVAEIFIPDDFIIEHMVDLPAGWNAYPYTSATTDFFSDKAKSRDFFALRVPSAVVGIEYNYVLNPLYRDFGQVVVEKFLKLPIDPRLR